MVVHNLLVPYFVFPLSSPTFSSKRESMQMTIPHFSQDCHKQGEVKIYFGITKTQRIYFSSSSLNIPFPLVLLSCINKRPTMPTDLCGMYFLHLLHYIDFPCFKFLMRLKAILSKLPLF